MRRVAHIMGMPVTIDIPGAHSAKVFKSTFNFLQEVDERFSPYKEGSELVLYQRGKLANKHLSPQMRKIIRACQRAEIDTSGYFSAYYGGKFDPTGYVKGWAIEEAGKILEDQGHKTYCIGAGGDVLARSDSSKEWKIGIENPKNQKYLTSKVIVKNIAVATSGTYQRGLHIINPETGKPANEALSITVVGLNIVKADVLSTAAFAAGLSGLVLVEEQEGYEALAVDHNEDIYMTSGMNEILRLP